MNDDRKARPLRVLVVEDEVIVGLDVVQGLAEAGFDAHGPFKSSAEALGGVEAVDPDVAVLDVNLGGDDTSEPVARRLQAEGRPFLFLTGYAASASRLLDGFPEAPRVSKPSSMQTLKEALLDLVR